MQIFGVLSKKESGREEKDGVIADFLYLTAVAEDIRLAGSELPSVDVYHSALHVTAAQPA